MRFVILLLVLFVISACGQDENNSNAEINEVSNVETFSTTLESKALLEVSFDNTEQGKTASEDATSDNADEEDSNQVSVTTETATSDAEGKSSSTSSSESEQVASSNQSTDSKSKEVSSDNSNNSSSASEQKSTESSKQKSQPKQASKPKDKKKDAKESEKKDETPQEPKKTVTVSVTSAADLNGPNVSPTQVEISDGETAFSATKKLLDSIGMKVDYTGSGAGLYVKGIDGLSEFDAGPLSGWHIYVQGELIPRSSDAYEVFDGQTIRWNYTKNFLEE